MLEQVSRMRSEALSEQQAGVDQPIERRSKLCLRLACRRLQQRMGEFPTDDRADLRHPLGRAQSVETRHQRSVQACRDPHGRARHRPNGSSRLAVTLRLQNRLCHLFDKEGNSVGPFDNTLADSCRDAIAPSDAVDHGFHVALGQPIKREMQSHEIVRSMAPRTPAGRSLKQYTKCPDPVYHPVEDLLGGWIRPVRILEDHQHRIRRAAASNWKISASSVFCRRSSGARSSTG